MREISVANNPGNAKAGARPAPVFSSGADFNLGHKQKHEEELWIFSYADLITNLLLFFLMMFAISKIDDDMLEVIGQAAKDEKPLAKPKPQAESSDKEQPTLTEEQLAAIASLSGSERNSQIVKQMQVLISRVDEKALKEDEEKKKAFEKMKEDLKKVADYTQEMTKGLETLDLRLPGDRVFPPGKETPLPEAQTFLSLVAREISAFPGKFSLVVEGHTDSTEALARVTPAPGKSSAAPTPLDKWELSSRRAASILEFLKAKGVKPGEASIAGYADTRPLVPEKDAAGKLIPRNQAQNRRVEIKIVRAPSNVPGVPAAKADEPAKATAAPARVGGGK